LTIASTTNRVSYSGNDVTTQFAFSAPYRASTDFTVIQRVTATGVETTKALTTDYTISGVANADTGGFDSMTLTMLVAPPTGTTLHIIRKVPPTSSYDPTAGSADTAPSREGSADRAVLAIQGVKDITRRALLQPETAANLDLVMPEPTEDTAGFVLAVNTAGDGFELMSLTDLDVALVSAYALSLLDDLNAAAARVTLGLKDSIIIAVSDETTPLTTGTAKVTFRMPYAMTLTDVRASVNTVSASGGPILINIKESGTTIFTTKLSIDDSEKTSVTGTAHVFSDTALADDAEITIDIDDAGDGAAKGLKVVLTGYRA
jgi:hypothetical protein